MRNQFAVSGFGDPSDIPMPGDYNGDGVTDIAVYRPTSGQWFVRNQFAVSFGDPGDIPVPADYNGDGKMDVAVYRLSTGQWFVRNQFTVSFGDVGDVGRARRLQRRRRGGHRGLPAVNRTVVRAQPVHGVVRRLDLRADGAHRRPAVREWLR